MKLYQKVVPYILMGSAAMLGHNSANAQNPTVPAPQLPKIEVQLPKKLIAKASEHYTLMSEKANTHFRLIARAEDTRDKYIENMLDAQKRLGPKVGTRGYRAAVRRELPGAPVGLHCMYGQYTQLMRALNENGDTLTVIPHGAKSACAAFKADMRAKYSKPEYSGAIHEGRAFESDSAYNAALEKYLVRHGIKDTSPAEERDRFVKEFAKHNFSLAQVNPGTIMIVPRFRGSKTKFHAIMFLGEGRVESGEFVPAATGHYMFTAHNRERIGDLIGTWDMSNVFSADIEKILQVEYTKELKRLESMPRDKMIEYIVTGTEISAERFNGASRGDLIRLVHAKYFGDDIQKALTNPVNPAQIAMRNAQTYRS